MKRSLLFAKWSKEKGKAVSWEVNARRKKNNDKGIFNAPLRAWKRRLENMGFRIRKT